MQDRLLILVLAIRIRIMFMGMLIHRRAFEGAIILLSRTIKYGKLLFIDFYFRLSNLKIFYFINLRSVEKILIKLLKR